MPIRKDFTLVILLILVTFFSYRGSFGNGFVWDDRSFVVSNPAIRDAGARSLWSYVTDWRTASDDPALARDVYRPLVTASFALDHRLWGLSAPFYHVENVVLHTANVLLVYLVVSLIAGSAAVAFLAALIFAVHPAQVEAVAWISGRSNVLFAFFYLLAFLMHVRGSSGPEGRRGSAPLGLFAAALFAKEAAVTLPFVMLLYDAVVARVKGIKAYRRYYAPFFLVLVLYCALRWAVTGTLAQGAKTLAGSLGGSLVMAVQALAGYIGILVLPFPLTIEYVARIPGSITEPALLLAFVSVGLAALLGVIFFRRNRLIFFCIAWFFVALVPVCSIVPFRAFMAERFLYLPLIGFAVIAAVGIVALGRVSRITACVVAAALIAAYAAATVARVADWRDELTLYARDLPKSPESARLHHNLAVAYCRETVFRPNGAHAPEGLGPCYAFAEKEFREAIRLQPDNAGAYLALGALYDQTGRGDMAMESYRRALALGDRPAALHNMGILSFKKGAYDEAIAYYKRALSLSPAIGPCAYANLGNAYFSKGDYGKARAAWDEAARLDPRNSAVTEGLKAIEAREGAAWRD